MREQAGWGEHAAFMNQLVERGVVVLGGPVGGSPRHRALLVARSPSEAELRNQLEQDPWMRTRILRLTSLEPWDLLLGRL